MHDLKLLMSQNSQTYRWHDEAIFPQKQAKAVSSMITAPLDTCCQRREQMISSAFQGITNPPKLPLSGLPYNARFRGPPGSICQTLTQSSQPSLMIYMYWARQPKAGLQRIHTYIHTHIHRAVLFDYFDSRLVIDYHVD